MPFNRLADMDLLPELAWHPRVDLGLIRTSLDPLERLGRRLGISLFAKRDDVQPLAMGGNKTRQLEFYLGLAAKQECDTVLITGAVQSNFVRSCAAAARKLGWHAVVQLEDRVPNDDPVYASSGNVLLDQMLGAEIHYFSEGENEAAADANLDRMAEDCVRRGKNPYVVHLGIDSPPVGGLGYAYAAAETWRQFEELGVFPDHVVIPSGSGLTHGGFLVGARAIGWKVPVHGICVRRSAELQSQRIARRSGELNAMIENKATLQPEDILVDDVTLAPGYGRINEAVSAAITHAAHDEALLLDPVYSGRTMAGLISLVERGVIEQGSTVAFIHTGGLPAIFAYQNELKPITDAG
ncbi:MAG: D-cysteine desulfhydrase family protein [Roseibium sp.]|uniref:D-cysteine desulfhydrase family protein n=1 Tax=Roseibium sp. TaxID=1936156 RepID=UPI0026059917|nr:D-cysteine desulfhydrase family protein [Roseibium sp.]MCV0426842.1 D-cysteine desulfhydrase family protein [Roseibium sp.]